MKKLLLFFFGIALVSCNNDSKDYIDVRGKEFAGSESCVQCHQGISEQAINTSHLKASMPATEDNVLGNFDDQFSAFPYTKNVVLKMKQNGDSLYQVVYVDEKPVEHHQFDIAFGAKHAQTSAYWKDGKLFELPISYYKSINGWATSPGFSNTEPFFNRLIKKDCFSCHSSNIDSPKPKGVANGEHYGSIELSGQLDQKSLIYGIDCERCHGPAAKHVQHHLKFPKETKAMFITTHKSLNNQQKLDRCAVCHSGNDDYQMKSRFQFYPGDSLSKFYLNKNRTSSDAIFDVHGAQLEVLKQSKCFQNDASLNCITCHNPHTNAETNKAYYSKICMNCHQENSTKFCKAQPFQSNYKNNCIDCHMPIKNSNVIKFKKAGSDKDYFYSLRTHQIGIYKIKK